MPAASIRNATPQDTPALYRICLQTAASGGDGSALYADSPETVGDLYAVPYARFRPGLAFVLDTDSGVAGYLVGTDDTAVFEDWLAAHWFPLLRGKYPADAAPEGSAAARLIKRFHAEPVRTDAALLGTHPAHLHVNLLPHAQGSGNGRALMEAFLDTLRSLGVPGVHLGLGDRNGAALAFYLRLGFREHSRRPGSITMLQDL